MYGNVWRIVKTKVHRRKGTVNARQTKNCRRTTVATLPSRYYRKRKAIFSVFPAFGNPSPFDTFCPSERKGPSFILYWDQVGQTMQ